MEAQAAQVQEIDLRFLLKKAWEEGYQQSNIDWVAGANGMHLEKKNPYS